MAIFNMTGLSDTLTAEVRETMRSPGYGHPVVREVARGTGPCRACFGLFQVGDEERLLFTYRPAGSDGSVGAPGPVFIHADRCERYQGDGFPKALEALPLLIEARASGGVVLRTRAVTGPETEAAIAAMLDDEAVDYLHVRHGEAGCHIGRVDRT